MTMLEHDWFPVPLPPNVTMGARSWVYSSFAFVHYRSRRGVRIGSDTGVYAGTFFDLGPEGEVTIGNFCSVVGAIICSNRSVLIDDFAFVAHEVVIADSSVAQPAPDAAAAGSITIGRNAWIGARAVIYGPVRVGEGAVVGAAAVVRDDVPPYAIAVGNPATLVGRAPAAP